VRDLFGDAKKHAPAIVFIDEIDAVGRRRGAGLGGGHDEREQTLNQLLVEMDGFGNNAGVIIIAATNRVDIRDPALMRPGRFDRQIYLGVPDKKGRKAILRVHAKRKPFQPQVDFDDIARSTVGFTGADLENLLNEAALLAARRNKDRIGNSEIDAAFLKVILGNEKRSRVVSDKERRITAFHEAGHAVAATNLETQDPVQQLSIVPRGRAGGFTINAPTEDKYYASKREMEEQMVALLGGRVAEVLVFGETYTGAGNDIEKVSEIARKMVTRYGMSDRLGTLVFSDHDEVFLGRDFTSSKAYSEATAALIDSEIKALVDAAFAQCKQLMSAHMTELTRVAETLLQEETLDAAGFKAAYAGLPLPQKPEPPVETDPDAKLPPPPADDGDGDDDRPMAQRIRDLTAPPPEEQP
jgi:cell division protease FtsH